MPKIIGNTTATPNPRPDWAQTDSTKADFIKNKPALGDLAAKNTVDKTDLAADVQESLNKADTAIQSVDNKVDKVDGKGLSTEDYTTAEKNKLDGIAAGAEVNVQSDWTQTNTGADDYIKNKPTLGSLAAKSTVIKTDLDSAVQASLDKADTALQSETDPTVPAWAKESTKPAYNLSEISDTSSYVRMTPDERTRLSGLAKGTANGVAELDANGKVPSAQLPSYVDDVLEYSAKASFPVTGETGKIYIDTTTNITYRWGGSTYVPIGSDLALGETSSTAYYGDKGKVAYEHAMIEDGNPHGVTADMVGALPLSGGTMTGELRVNGGDKVGGSKIVLETGSGQITNDGTQTLFGFLDASKIGVGHGSYVLELRGNTARPTYNNKDMALKSDVDVAIGDINSILDAINGEVV